MNIQLPVGFLLLNTNCLLTLTKTCFLPASVDPKIIFGWFPACFCHRICISLRICNRFVTFMVGRILTLSDRPAFHGRIRFRCLQMAGRTFPIANGSLFVAFKSLKRFCLCCYQPVHPVSHFSQDLHPHLPKGEWLENLICGRICTRNLLFFCFPNPKIVSTAFRLISIRRGTDLVALPKLLCNSFAISTNHFCRNNSNSNQGSEQEILLSEIHTTRRYHLFQ